MRTETFQNVSKDQIKVNLFRRRFGRFCCCFLWPTAKMKSETRECGMKGNILSNGNRLQRERDKFSCCFFHLLRRKKNANIICSMLLSMIFTRKNDFLFCLFKETEVQRREKLKCDDIIIFVSCRDQLDDSYAGKMRNKIYLFITGNITVMLIPSTLLS